MAIPLEVCVDTLQGAQIAAAHGAARIELCSALSEGGLTPSYGLMKAAAALPIPTYAMIRPRAGLFHFTAEDEVLMVDDITAAREAGLAGVVLGAQGSTDGLNQARLARLSAAAGNLGRTLHRVIDVVPDPLLAIDQAADLGFERVLTSGAAAKAPEGAKMIRAMVTRADGRLSVMAGSGVTPENVRTLIAETGVREVHASCAAPVAGDPAFSNFDPPGGRRDTAPDAVQAMVAALQA